MKIQLSFDAIEKLHACFAQGKIASFFAGERPERLEIYSLEASYQEALLDELKNSTVNCADENTLPPNLKRLNDVIKDLIQNRLLGAYNGELPKEFLRFVCNVSRQLIESRNRTNNAKQLSASVRSQVKVTQTSSNHFFVNKSPLSKMEEELSKEITWIQASLKKLNSLSLKKDTLDEYEKIKKLEEFSQILKESLSLCHNSSNKAGMSVAEKLVSIKKQLELLHESLAGNLMFLAGEALPNTTSESPLTEFIKKIQEAPAKYEYELGIICMLGQAGKDYCNLKKENAAFVQLITLMNTMSFPTPQKISSPSLVRAASEPVVSDRMQRRNSIP